MGKKTEGKHSGSSADIFRVDISNREETGKVVSRVSCLAEASRNLPITSISCH